MTLKELLNSGLLKGYLLLPRVLLTAAIEGDAFALSLIRVIAAVNYADRLMVYGNKRYLCRKAESIRSLKSWATELGMSIAEVKTFFAQLRQMGYLEPIENPLHGGHIRLAEYERLTGKDYTLLPDSQAGTAGDERLFEGFWKRYHEMTHLIPREKALAWVYWIGMTPEEMDAAYERIADYYKGLPNKEHCRKAASYLKYRSFE